jgi:hypothetical protein
MIPQWLYSQFIKKILQDTKNELWQNLSVLTFKYFYNMTEDLNFRWKSIWSFLTQGKHVCLIYAEYLWICLELYHAVYNENM